MKRLVSLALSVILLAIPASAMARGGHGHGGHGQGGIVALPFAFPFGFYDGPLYYCDPLGVYPSDALIYDPQSGMVWVPGHWELFTDWVWIPGHWERLRTRSLILSFAKTAFESLGERPFLMGRPETREAGGRLLGSRAVGSGGRDLLSPA